jgi:phosphoglucomutase
MEISPFAGKLPDPTDLVDIESLVSAYYSNKPEPSIASQKVLFGTSGHRGSSFDVSFNENHILTITQAICLYRKIHGINGPLFLGFDTHALSIPAFRSAMEVLAANDVNVMIAQDEEFTPTPVISHAILSYNRERKEGLADGIVITPSHNPPREGGFKYNPAHGGPAEKEITDWIQNQANAFLFNNLKGVKQIPFDHAFKATTTHQYDFLNPYIFDLGNVVDMDLIRDSGIKIGVDPMGGAGVHYWQPIADLYKIDLCVLNTKTDPCFRFMTRDWDGQIRMDPSSSYAMQGLIQKSQDHDISFACDTDHDRHGIVTKSSGLMPPNHYLAAAIFYLFQHRPLWSSDLKVGKTLVSSQMIDRVAKKLNRSVFEVPVGFKWFVDGLLQSQLGFAGEESAGATFLRLDGKVWTTDKDGFVPGLLAAEMTARLAKDPAVLYHEVTESMGNSFYTRFEAAATVEQKAKISNLSPGQISNQKIAGDGIEKVLTNAPGNDASIGGFKIESKNGWIAARPSGTEDIYKIYAESFIDQDHLNRLVSEGQAIVDRLLAEPLDTERIDACPVDSFK